MPDLADVAEGLREEHLSRSLSRIAADIPAGVRGECEECGEDMPRLVNGRCGYCRDGRLPPADRDPTPPITPAVSAHTKEKTMPNPPPTADRRQVCFPATGAVLQAIMAGVDGGASLAGATIALIERGLANAPIVPDAVVAEVPPAAADRCNLADYDLDELLDELRERASGHARVRDLMEDLSEQGRLRIKAERRADQAEARLARVSAILGGDE